MNESVPEFNDNLVAKLSIVPNFWKLDGSSSKLKLDVFGDVANLDISQSLEEGLSGQIHYIARLPGYLARDISQSDDFIRLRIDTNQVNYKDFCTNTYPKLIGCFQAYRSSVETDNEVMLGDFEQTKIKHQLTGKDINGRDSVSRIWPVCFFDNSLCKRAFNICADEVVALAAAECEYVKVLHDGAFIRVTSDIVVGADLDLLNARLMTRLGQYAGVSPGCSKIA